MAEEKVNVKKPFKGAKVDWPADMPKPSGEISTINFKIIT